MKITRRQLRRLIKESQNSTDTQSILEAHATISYFYGYVSRLLVHARTADYQHEFSRPLGRIDTVLAGLLEEAGMLRVRAGAKVTQITGTRLATGREFRSLMQEAKENAETQINKSYGDAYGHLLTLSYEGNNVLGTMALIDAAHIISPGIQLEFRLDVVEDHLTSDQFLNAMDSLT